MTAKFDHGYALLIGVGHCSYDKWSLPVTVVDMTALRDLLVEPTRCAYPPGEEHVRLLHDQGATRSAILDGLTGSVPAPSRTPKRPSSSTTRATAGWTNRAAATISSPTTWSPST